MAAETVKFYVKDQNSDPILGVLVRVFDLTGTTFITQDYTVDVGGDAVAEVTLDGDDPPSGYTIRASKAGVAFDGALGDSNKSPQLVEIYSPAALAPTGKNDFDLVGETFTRPVATDPRLCRCSGFFKDITGQPLPNLEMFFINQFAPAIVDGDGVLGSKVELRTDADGYAQLDLYRGAEYSVMVQSLQAAEADDTGAIVFPRHIVVPDQSSINLLNLLFPVVDEITFTPDPVTMSVGDYLDVTTVVKATDERTLVGTGCEDVIYESSDTDVVTVSVEQDKLVLYAVGAGTAEITAVRKDQTIVSIPATTIAGQPLSVTVT
jgi:hypothetical protein